MTTKGPSRGPVRAFNAYASRSPRTWQKVAAVVMAVALPLALWDKRGALVGVLAFLVYGGVFLTAAFNSAALLAWSRRHVAVDGASVVPLAFLALAYITTLSLWLCVLIALAAGAVLVPVAVWRRGADQTAQT